MSVCYHETYCSSNTSSSASLIHSVDEVSPVVVGLGRHDDDFESSTPFVDSGDEGTRKASLSEILEWKKGNDLASGSEVVISLGKSRAAGKTVEEMT